MGYGWLTLVGGFAFFFYGLTSVRRGLHFATGDRVRGVLGKITSNRFMAAFFGAVTTLALQSSGATSAMLVSFADNALIGVAPAVAVLLGADIGTTLVVILFSIKWIADMALAIVAIGFFWEAIASSRRAKRWGDIILGFGLLFYGLKMMTIAAAPLGQDPLAKYAFSYLVGSPWALLLLSAALTVLIHSAGTIGIAIALSFAGMIDFTAAFPIVLGANLGTCSTALLAALGAGSEGRQVAGAHIISKVAGVFIVMPFVGHLSLLLERLSPYNLAIQIALIHVCFNVGLAIVLLPLLGWFVKIVGKILPAVEEKKKVFGPKYLEKAALEVPALAHAQVKREIQRMAGIVRTMIGDCLRMFSRSLDAYEEAEKITQMDDRVDKLEKAIRFYLAELGQSNLAPEQSRRGMSLLSMASDLEEIGDSLSREMVSLAKKKARWHRLFSDDGWRDLRNFQAKVEAHFDLALSIMANRSSELLQRARRMDEEIMETEQEFRQAHLKRLSQGLQESFDTSSIHLDILANLRRVSGKILHFVEMEMAE